MPLSDDDYVFFWKPNELYGWASQWYQSPFTVSIDVHDFGEVTFATAEHWMMFQKALLFDDPSVARKVLATTDLAEVKALGRKVNKFDDTAWNANRDRIVLEGSLNKFRQNEELKDELLKTGKKRLVEASPRDRIWGVGYGHKNALKMKDNWGLNLLGIALEKAREVLRGEDKTE